MVPGRPGRGRRGLALRQGQAAQGHYRRPVDQVRGLPGNRLRGGRGEERPHLPALRPALPALRPRATGHVPRPGLVRGAGRGTPLPGSARLQGQPRPLRRPPAVLPDETGREDALVSGVGRIDGHPIVVCVFEFGFMGGSMASVVGEKITRAIELATRKRIPLLVVTCSGGARMQEGVLSLMQMAKTSAALGRLAEERVPYFVLLADPTTGGVTASFAMLGDLIFAEPRALIGFAGPRVIQETIRQPLPEGFQRAEFLLEHGMVDKVVERKDLRETLRRLLAFFAEPVEPAAP